MGGPAVAVPWAIPDAPLLLGIDVGTSRTKAVLVDEAGTEAASSARPTPFVVGPAGVEADAGALLDTVAAVVAALGVPVRRAVGVGIAGLAESGAPVDQAGRPLAPVMAWHDPRGAEAVAVLEERFGDELARRIGQRLRPVSSVAKLGWSAAHGAAGVRWWLGVPELVLFALTGRRATDYSLAARTGAYDVVARRHIADVVEALGLPPDVFPEPAPAGAVMGEVTPAGAAWSGLAPATPVTVAGHDHLAGMTGAGAGPGDLANSVGTAETVVGRRDRVPDIDRALASGAAVTLWPDGTGWAVLASAARAGLVLEAAARGLGRPPAELDALAGDSGVVDAAAYVDGVAAAVKGRAGPDPVLPAGSPGRVWNGVLAALAARTWEAAGLVDELCRPSRRLVVFGGGGRSRPWLRAKAGAGFVPVVRSVAAEAAARGAAVRAGVAAGWWPSPDAAPAPTMEPVEP